jgi:hypothetical protein
MINVINTERENNSGHSYTYKGDDRQRAFADMYRERQINFNNLEFQGTFSVLEA